MATRPEEKNSWIGTTDFLFSFCEEKKPENGEDSLDRGVPGRPRRLRGVPGLV